MVAQPGQAHPDINSSQQPTSSPKAPPDMDDILSSFQYLSSEIQISNPRHSQLRAGPLQRSGAIRRRTWHSNDHSPSARGRNSSESLSSAPVEIDSTPISAIWEDRQWNFSPVQRFIAGSDDAEDDCEGFKEVIAVSSPLTYFDEPDEHPQPRDHHRQHIQRPSSSSAPPRLQLNPASPGLKSPNSPSASTSSHTSLQLLHPRFPARLAQGHHIITDLPNNSIKPSPPPPPALPVTTAPATTTSSPSSNPSSKTSSPSRSTLSKTPPRQRQNSSPSPNPFDDIKHPVYESGTPAVALQLRRRLEKIMAEWRAGNDDGDDDDDGEDDIDDDGRLRGRAGDVMPALALGESRTTIKTGVGMGTVVTG